MKVQLLTGKKRELVARFEIPEFNPGPEILNWGTRSFIRADEELMDTKDNQKERITNYVEGMAYHLVATSRKWEPVDND